MFLDLVQNSVLDVATREVEKTRTLWGLIVDGGPLMIPIILLSVVAIYIFVERILSIQGATKQSTSFMGQINELVKEGKLDEAKSICDKVNTPISRMISKGLSRIGLSLQHIEAAIENVGKIEVGKMEKNLSMLATISGAAPMIGFLGTVIGMIQTFMQLDKSGTANTSELAGGIYVALITTVAGLIVGIIAYIAYNFLTAKVQKVVHQMEHSSVEFLDVLQEPQK